MSRKDSREKAMEILFSMELTKDNDTEALENFVENYEEDINLLDLDYIKTVLKGVYENKNDIDKIIESNLQNWKLDRISKINLTILRMAIFEMNNLNDVPGKVAINEALELTKKYSDEKSSHKLPMLLCFFFWSFGRRVIESEIR